MEVRVSRRPGIVLRVVGIAMMAIGGTGFASCAGWTLLFVSDRPDQPYRGEYSKGVEGIVTFFVPFVLSAFVLVVLAGRFVWKRGRREREGTGPRAPTPPEETV